MSVCYWNGRLWFDSRSGQTKDYKNCDSLLPCLMFSCKKDNLKPPPYTVDQWQLDSKTKRSPRCLQAMATWWIKCNYTNIITFQKKIFMSNNEEMRYLKAFEFELLDILYEQLLLFSQRVYRVLRNPNFLRDMFVVSLDGEEYVLLLTVRNCWFTVWKILRRWCKM